MVKKILLFKVGALGDVVMTTPLIRSLRKKYPNSQIDYLVGSYAFAVLKNNKNINEVITFDQNIVFKKKFFKLLELASKIRKKRYDVCLVLDKSWNFGLFARLFGCKTYGFVRPGEPDLNSKSVRYNNGMHEIDFYLKLGALLGAKTTDKKVEIPITRQDLSFAKEKLSSITKKQTRPNSRQQKNKDKQITRQIIGVIPGGANNPAVGVDLVRRLPKKTFLEVIKILSKKYEIILLGGKDDTRYNEQFMISSHVHNMTADTIQESVALMKHCKWVICNDSGPMHFAAASGTKVLSLFGPTSPLRKAPLTKGSVAIWKDSDIYDGNYELYGTPPKTKGFFKRISAKDIVDVIKSGKYDCPQASSKKVCFASLFATTRTYGAETSTLLVASGLKNKSDIFLISAAKTKTTPIRTFSLHLKRLKLPDIVLNIGNKCVDRFMYRKILKILKCEMPSVVHIHDYSILNAAQKAADTLRIPSVLTVRDFRHQCNLAICALKGKFKYGCSKQIYLSCLKKSLNARYGRKSVFLSMLLFPLFYSQKETMRKVTKKVDKIIAVSNFVKSSLIKSKIHPKQIQVVYVPKPDWDFNVQKIRKTTIVHKPYKRIILFSAGLLAKQKGFQILIDALKILRHNDSNIVYELRIAGQGLYESQLKKMGANLNVKFLGKISKQKMIEEYLRCDIVLQSSIIPESLSRIIFEAMSMKKPIIGANSGGNGELLRTGGFLIAKNDAKTFAKAIIKLSHDKWLRTKVGNEGYKLINEVANMSVIIKKHIRIYRALKNDCNY